MTESEDYRDDEAFEIILENISIKTTVVARAENGRLQLMGTKEDLKALGKILCDDLEAAIPNRER